MGDFFDTMTIVVVIIMVYYDYCSRYYHGIYCISDSHSCFCKAYTNDFRQKVRFETKGYSQIK